MSNIKVNSMDDIFDLNNKLKVIAIKDNGQFDNIFSSDYQEKENPIRPNTVPDYHDEFVKIYLKEVFNYDFNFSTTMNVYERANELGIMLFFDTTPYREGSDDRQALLIIPEKFTEMHRNYLNYTQDIMKNIYKDGEAINMILMSKYKANDQSVISYNDFMERINFKANSK